MQPATQTTLLGVSRQILNGDPTLTPKDVSAHITAIARVMTGEPATTTEQTRRVEMLTRKQAAQLLCRSSRAVDLLAAQGHLTKVKMPGRVRAAGFRRDEVEALITGGAA